MILLRLLGLLWFGFSDKKPVILGNTVLQNHSLVMTQRKQTNLTWNGIAWFGVCKVNEYLLAIYITVVKDKDNGDDIALTIPLDELSGQCLLIIES